MTFKETLYLVAAILAIIAYFIAIFEIKKLRKDLHAEKRKSDDLEMKMRAFFITAKFENVDTFMKEGELKDFENLGFAAYQRAHELRTQLDSYTQKDDYCLEHGKHELQSWFGLSKASFLVLPRIFMQEMGPRWQGKMAKLLNEYDAVFDDSDNGVYDSYSVRLKMKGRLIKTPEWLVDYQDPDKYQVKEFKIDK